MELIPIMKTFRIFLCAAMAAAISSACTKEDVKAVPEEPAADSRVEMTFTASLEGGADTKTQLGAEADGKMPVLWQATDKLGVWDGTSLNEFSIPSSVTDFTGSVDFTGTAEDGQDMYYAVYPYSAEYEFVMGTSNMEVTGAVIPTEQKAVKGSYDPSAAVSVAYSAEKEFAMRNVTTLVKIAISSSDIKSVTVTASDGQYLAGKSKLVIKEYPAVYAQSDRTDYVTLTSETAMEPGDYYIAMIPRTLEGLSVKYTKTDGSIATVSTKKTVELARASILPLNIDDSKLTFVAPEEPEPGTLELTIDFSAQPFTTDLPAGSSNAVTDEAKTYTFEYNEASYEFILYSKNGFFYNASDGYLRMNSSASGKGYIKLPAVADKKLISVIAYVVSDKTMYVSSTATNSGDISADQQMDETTKAKTFSLAETSVNKSYYLYAGAKNTSITKLVLTYTE